MLKKLKQVLLHLACCCCYCICRCAAAGSSRAYPAGVRGVRYCLLTCRSTVRQSVCQSGELQNNIIASSMGTPTCQVRNMQLTHLHTACCTVAQLSLTDSVLTSALVGPK